MPLFRNKPVFIQAVYFGGEDDVPAIQTMAMPNVVQWRKPENGHEYLELHTTDGVLNADVGVYVVKDEAGDLRTCAPSEFDRMYEVVPTGSAQAA